MYHDLISFDKLPGAEAAKKMSPVMLAFVGDAVYELLVRQHLVVAGVGAHKMHHAAVGFVNAGGQADVAAKLLSALTEEELLIFRRGRNANTGRVPRGASAVDYRNATGLEALFGYLYLSGEHDRLREIFALVLSFCAQEDKASDLS